MSVLKLSLTFTVLFVLAVSIFALEGCAASSEEVALAIERAESTVVSSYQAVLEAEDVGANVSGLLARLNEAGDLLAKAHVLYRLGDFDGAARFADLCSQIGEEVRIEAYGLRGLAVEEAVQRFRWTMIGSILSVTIIISASFVSWRFFKLRYYRRILGMRPEVVSDES